MKIQKLIYNLMDCIQKHKDTLLKVQSELSAAIEKLKDMFYNFFESLKKNKGKIWWLVKLIKLLDSLWDMLL